MRFAEYNGVNYQFPDEYTDEDIQNDILGAIKTNDYTKLKTINRADTQAPAQAGDDSGNFLTAGWKKYQYGSALEATTDETLSPEASEYATFKAKRAREAWETEQSKLGTIGQIGSELVAAAPAIAGGMINLPLGGIAAYDLSKRQALIAQDQESGELDIDKARLAGLGSAAVDMATGGLGSKLIKGLPTTAPWQATMAKTAGIRAAEDATSNAAGQIFENLAANKDWGKDVPEAALMGVGAGAALRGSTGALQKVFKTPMNAGGEKAVQDLNSVKSKQLAPTDEFADNAYGYSNLAKQAEDDILNGTFDSDAKYEEALRAKSNLSSQSGDAASLKAVTLLDQYNIPVTDAALNINVSRTADGAGERINLAKQLGISDAEITSAEIHGRGARDTLTRFGRKKAIDEGVTTESHQKQVQTAAKNAFGDIEGNYLDGNIRTAQTELDLAVKRGDPQVVINQLKDLVTDLKTYRNSVLENLSSSRKNFSGELETLGPRVLRSMYDTGMNTKLKGLDGKPGSFDMANDAMAIRTLMDIVEKQVPTYHQGVSDPWDVAGPITGASSSNLLPRAARMANIALKSPLGPLSRSMLRQQKAKTQERVKALSEGQAKVDEAVSSGNAPAAADAAAASLNQMGINTSGMETPSKFIEDTTHRPEMSVERAGMDEAFTPVREAEAPKVEAPIVTEAPIVKRQPLPTKLRAQTETEKSIKAGEKQLTADQKKAFEESEKMAAEEARKQAQVKRDAEALKPAPKKSRTQRKAEREAKSRQKAEEIRKQRQEEANAKVEDFSQKAEPVKEAPKAKITAAKPKPKPEPEAVVETVPVAPKAPVKVFEGMTGKPKQPQAEAPESAPKASESVTEEPTTTKAEESITHAKETAKTRKAPLPRKRPEPTVRKDLEGKVESLEKLPRRERTPEQYRELEQAKEDLKDHDMIVEKLTNLPRVDVEEAIQQMGGMAGVREHRKKLGDKGSLDTAVRNWIANKNRESIDTAKEKLSKLAKPKVDKAEADAKMAAKRMAEAEDVFKAKDVPVEIIEAAKNHADGNLAVFKARVGQLLKNAAEAKKTRSDNAKKAAKTKLKNAEDMRKRAEETFTSRSYAEKYVKGLGVSDSRITDLLNNTYGNPKAKIPKKVSVNQVNDLMNKIDNLLDQDLKAYQGLVKKSQDPTGEVAAKIKALTERKAQMQALKAEQEKAIADAKAESKKAAEADLEAQRLADEAEAEVKAAEEKIASRKKLDSQLDEMVTELKAQGASDDFIQEHVYMAFFKEDKPLTDKAFATARKKATKELQKHADKVALENQKAAEEILGELSGSALSESTKDIVMKAAGATGEASAEQRGVVQALEKTLKEKGVKEEAEFVSVFSDILNKLEERKAAYPHRQDLWISREDYIALQDSMNEASGSSYMGNLGEKLRMKAFGYSKGSEKFITHSNESLKGQMKIANIDEDIKIH